VLGLVGHDPWKPDEAYTFGLVYHILEAGDWLVPTLAGEPFVEKPPLFFWTAALFCKLLAGRFHCTTLRALRPVSTSR
jgi:4-amino-4-deoxy-L-arabinose transferase-like glycosyltransferase